MPTDPTLRPLAEIEADLAGFDPNDLEYDVVASACIDRLLADIPALLTEITRLRGLRISLVYGELREEIARVTAERDALKQQAEIHAQEARTQRATVQEIYQLCTGATGEPGDWHGAEPVRALVAERDALRDFLVRVLHETGVVGDDPLMREAESLIWRK